MKRIITRLCKVCGKPLPKDRRSYCSSKCKALFKRTNYKKGIVWVLNMVTWKWKKENRGE
jgi:predicted nucleic acid-binding Zn ribbon protein